MTKPVVFKKNSIVMRISESEVAWAEGFKQKGHWEESKWTDETRELVKEAHGLIEQIEKHPYIQYDMDGRPYVEEPLTKKWVAEETHEEWLTRWRESR